MSGAIEDTTWLVTNDGNTAASYAIKLVLNSPVPAGFGSQLTPAQDLHARRPAQDCTLALQPHTILLANIPNPTFTTPQNPPIEPVDPESVDSESDDQPCAG